MRERASVLATALSACLALAACERPSPKPNMPSAANATTAATAEPAPAGNRCYPRGKPPAVTPAVVAAHDPDDEPCRALLDKHMRQVEAALRRNYPQHLFPSRTFVSFDCDPVQVAQTIALEQADERDGELLVVDLFADADSNGHQLLALRVNLLRSGPPHTGYHSRPGDTFAVSTAHSSVSRASFDLELVRTAAAATIREVALADYLGGVKGVSGNHRVHQLLFFSALPFDRPGEQLSYQRHAHGIDESMPRMDSALIPLRFASEPILNLLTKIAFTAPSSDSRHRAAEQELLTSRFLASFPPAEPWLRELYLALAARLGDTRLVPIILDSALHGERREQELAIDALTQITGWDQRRDSNGVPREPNAVAAAYAAECAR